MNIDIQRLSEADVPALWRINEEGLPGVGKVSPDAMSRLVDLCVFPMGAFFEGTLAGFVLCLEPKTSYGSLNYAWFNDNFAEFLYVDRIAVAERFRDQNVGSRLYSRVFEEANQREWPVAAEVNISPPNPGSMRFHHRHGFDRVGTLEHDHYTVGMVLRPLPAAAP
jgi:predicted GNAT superfamily acetyltransferase